MCDHLAAQQSKQYGGQVGDPVLAIFNPISTSQTRKSDQTWSETWQLNCNAKKCKASWIKTIKIRLYHDKVKEENDLRCQYR